MKNFNFSPIESVEKGFTKGVRGRAKGAAASGVPLPWKEENSPFFHLWSKQQQKTETIQSSRSPIVIPVNRTAARFSQDSAVDPVKSAGVNRKAEEQKTPKNASTKAQAGSGKALLEFVLPIPPASVADHSAVEQTKGQTVQEQLLLKLVQAALNSRQMQTQLDGLSPKILKVNVTFRGGESAFRLSGLMPGKTSALKVSAGQGKLAHSAAMINAADQAPAVLQSKDAQVKSSSLLFKNFSGLMWQPVENAQEMEQIAQQLKGSAIREINLQLKPAASNVFEVSFDAAEQKKSGVDALRQNFKVEKNGVASSKSAPIKGQIKAAGQEVRSLKNTINLKAAEPMGAFQENEPEAAVPQSDAEPQTIVLKVQAQEGAGQKAVEGVAQNKKVKLLGVQIHQLAQASSSTPHGQTMGLVKGAPAGSNMGLFVARIQEMVDQAQNMKLRSGQIRMSLEDTPMGKVDLKFQRSEHQLTVVVENEQVRHELLRLAPIIQNQLAEKGIVLQSFQVNVGHFEQSTSGRQSSEKRNHSLASSNGGKEIEHESQSTVNNRKFGYNTMEITV